MRAGVSGAPPLPELQLRERRGAQHPPVTGLIFGASGLPIWREFAGLPVPWQESARIFDDVGLTVPKVAVSRRDSGPAIPRRCSRDAPPMAPPVFRDLMSSGKSAFQCFSGFSAASDSQFSCPFGSTRPVTLSVRVS